MTVVDRSPVSYQTSPPLLSTARQTVRTRRVAAMLFALGLAGLAAGAWLAWARRDAVLIVPVITDLGVVEPGRELPVRFAVVNRGRSPVRIAGCELLCGPDGCLTGDCFPFELAPGASQEVELGYKPPRSPKFDYDGRIYTDAPGQAQVLFHIVGRTSAPPAAERAAARPD